MQSRLSNCGPSHYIVIFSEEPGTWRQKRDKVEGMVQEEEWRANANYRQIGNKTELLKFLAETIVEMHTANVVVNTKEDNFLSNRTIGLDEVAPYTHEEADMRLFLLAKNATEEGSIVVMIKSKWHIFSSSYFQVDSCAPDRRFNRSGIDLKGSHSVMPSLG